jgi:hypothetical protein
MVEEWLGIMAFMYFPSPTNVYVRSSASVPIRPKTGQLHSAQPRLLRAVLYIRYVHGCRQPPTHEVCELYAQMYDA